MRPKKSRSNRRRNQQTRSLKFTTSYILQYFIDPQSNNHITYRNNIQSANRAFRRNILNSCPHPTGSRRAKSNMAPIARLPVEGEEILMSMMEFSIHNSV